MLTAINLIRRRCRLGSGNPRLAVSAHRSMHCAVDEMYRYRHEPIETLAIRTTKEGAL
jgi:hypothetical protein